MAYEVNVGIKRGQFMETLYLNDEVALIILLPTTE